MTTITAITSFMSVWNAFVNPGLENEANHAELAKAIQSNSCSDAELDQLEEILSSPEESEHFFNNPIVQRALLRGLIANTYMDNRVIAAMKTCTPCVSFADQEDIFDNKFSWALSCALNNPFIATRCKIALRFFTDIPSAQEILTAPYSPTKYPDQNFNGQVKFSGANKVITCRHYSTQMLIDLDSTNHKASYDNFSSPEKIAQHIKPDIEAKYQHIKRSATEVHLIKNANWGQLISKQFEEMDKQEVKIKRMLVESTGHAMAAWLRIKVKDGKKCYVVHFYEPNSTTTHIRAKAYDLANVKFRTMGAFLNVRSSTIEQRLYPEAEPISMIYIVPESDKFHSQFHSQNTQQHQTVSLVDRKLTSCDVDLNAITIWHLMASGFAGTLKEIDDKIKTLPQDEKLIILNARLENGASGLFMALQNGHADAIKAYGELLAAAGIQGPELIAILEAKVYFMTGLRSAFLNGHTNTAKAYVEVLKKLISGTELVNLLAAKHIDIQMCASFLISGSTDNIKTYGELLEASGISVQDKVKLLTDVKLFSKKENEYESYRLRQLLKEGTCDAFIAYCKVIETLAPQLDQKQKISLLTMLRESHSHTVFGKRVNDAFYNQLKKDNPDFYRQFKATKDALKA